MNFWYFKPLANGIDWSTQEPIEWLNKHQGRKCWAEIGLEEEQRTDLQNKSIHKGFQLLADKLNDGGLTMQKVLKPAVEIEWDGKSVKKYLFKPIMEALLDKKSTTELAKGKNEIERVWNTMMRFLGEKHHVEYIPVPSKLTIK